MKIEIKCRAYHEDGQMIYQESSLVPDAIKFWKAIYYDAETMLYIGKKDTNKKEIYAGDFCSASINWKGEIIDIRGEIIMDEYMWCLDCGDDMYSVNRLFNLEIFGNYHETPGLLTKKSK